MSGSVAKAPGKQPTLGKFGFTKSLKTSKGSSFRVHMENYVKSKEGEKKNTGVVFPHCPCNSTNFTSYQYLNHHITYKHPMKNRLKKNKKKTNQKQKRKQKGKLHLMIFQSKMHRMEYPLRIQKEVIRD